MLKVRQRLVVGFDRYILMLHSLEEYNMVAGLESYPQQRPIVHV